jgi:hypothetical protein
MATTVAGAPCYLESDGQTVNVDLLYAVEANSVIYVDGWLGIAGEDGVSGDTIALINDEREYQFKVPAGLTVNKGDEVFITLATVTGHYPDDEAYTTESGAGKVPMFKATSDKDANNIVTGIQLDDPSAFS